LKARKVFLKVKVRHVCNVRPHLQIATVVFTNVKLIVEYIEEGLGRKGRNYDDECGKFTEVYQADRCGRRASFSESALRYSRMRYW